MTDKLTDVERAIDETTVDGFRLRDLPADRMVVDRLINKAVKAAIEAMRSPTEAMLEAADSTHSLCDPGPYPSSPGDSEIWQSMIDAALEGGSREET